MKKKKIRKKKKKIGYIYAISLAAIIFLAIVALTHKPTVQTTLTKEEILNKLKEFPEVRPYINLPANITLLTKSNLTELSKQYPAIYGNISKDVYEVKFSFDTSGLLVIYDAEQNKIIRIFEIIGVKLE
jgi:hypothetical protein